MSRNLFFHYLSLITDMASSKISTFIMRCIAVALGIDLGKSNTFRGLMKFRLYKDTSIMIGNNCSFRNKYASNMIGVNHPCIIATHARNGHIKIGNHCGFSGTVIGAFASITLGNNVRCGANTLITDGDWHTDDPRCGKPKPIVIEDSVWLGYNAVVLKGVTIGENAIIGANSVVTKDIPANVVAAGNPCRVIREFN